MKRPSLLFLILVTRIFHDIPLLWMFYFLHVQKEGVGGFSDVVWNAGLFVGFAGVHSLLARRFARAHLTRLVGEPLVRPLYVWVSGLTLLLLLLLWRPLEGILWRTQGLAYGLLTLFYLAALVGLAYTTRFIDYQDFLGIRAVLRQLREQPSRPSGLSLRGPYAHCRHPLYLLLFLALWMGPVMTWSRFEFAFLASFYLLIGTRLEERNLREELGEIYEEYRTQVPMWIPRIRPWRPKHIAQA